MSVSNKLNLKFNTNFGEVFTLPISNADPTVDQARVSQAMDDIISYNIFSSMQGDLVSKNAADITKIETTEISVSL